MTAEQHPFPSKFCCDQKVWASTLSEVTVKFHYQCDWFACQFHICEFWMRGPMLTKGPQSNKQIYVQRYTIMHIIRIKYKSCKCKRVNRVVVGNHWKSLSSFHASLNASLCLLNADARTRPVEDLIHALCSMEMRFLLLKPSCYRPASTPVGSTQLSWILLDLSGLLSISLFSSSLIFLLPLCRRAQRFALATANTYKRQWVCRQQPKNPFILSSGASLVLEHVFLWAEHYKRFHILLSVKP